MGTKNAMSNEEIARLRSPGKYTVGGVGGLVLQVEPNGTRMWHARFSVAGKERQMSIGSADDISPDDARHRVAEIRSRMREMANIAEESAFAECLPIVTPSKGRKVDIPITTKAPWTRTMQQQSEATGHAMAARILEICEPSITRALREAVWQAMEEILEADRAA